MARGRGRGIPGASRATAIAWPLRDGLGAPGGKENRIRDSDRLHGHRRLETCNASQDGATSEVSRPWPWPGWRASSFCSQGRPGAARSVFALACGWRCGPMSERRMTLRPSCRRARAQRPPACRRPRGEATDHHLRSVRRSTRKRVLGLPGPFSTNAVRLLSLAFKDAPKPISRGLAGPLRPTLPFLGRLRRRPWGQSFPGQRCQCKSTILEQACQDTAQGSMERTQHAVLTCWHVDTPTGWQGVGVRRAGMARPVHAWRRLNAGPKVSKRLTDHANEPNAPASPRTRHIGPGGVDRSRVVRPLPRKRAVRGARLPVAAIRRSLPSAARPSGSREEVRRERRVLPMTKSSTNAGCSEMGALRTSSRHRAEQIAALPSWKRVNALDAVTRFRDTVAKFRMSGRLFGGATVVAARDKHPNLESSPESALLFGFQESGSRFSTSFSTGCRRRTDEFSALSRIQCASHWPESDSPCRTLHGAPGFGAAPLATGSSSCSFMRHGVVRA